MDLRAAEVVRFAWVLSSDSAACAHIYESRCEHTHLLLLSANRYDVLLGTIQLWFRAGVASVCGRFRRHSQ
jgi:hypothetical protein